MKTKKTTSQIQKVINQFEVEKLVKDLRNFVVVTERLEKVVNQK